MATATTETTTNIPENLEEYQLDIINRARELGTQDFQLPGFSVAGMTPVQQLAMQRGLAGIGAYQPMLQAGANTLGLGIEGMTGGFGTLNEALANLRGAGMASRDAVSGAMPFRDAALSTYGSALDATRGVDLGSIRNYGDMMAGAGMRSADDIRRASMMGQGDVFNAQRGIMQGIGDARGAAGQTRADIDAALGTAGEGVGASVLGARRDAGQGVAQGTLGAARGGRDATMSQRQLGRAGEFGLDAASQGIGALAGTGTRFSPEQISPFMNQFEDAAVKQALADIREQGEEQRAGLDAQAVAAGAFGGGRAALQQAKLTDDILEQQGRTAAGMRQAGFESAAGRAQRAFEDQQARQQRLAGLTGQLGTAGAGALTSAAGTAGQLGLGAGRLGLGAGQLGAQTGLGLGQLGVRGAQGLGQLGISGAGTAGRLGLGAGQLGVTGSGQMGQLGLAGADQLMRGASGAGQMELGGLRGGLGAAGTAAQLGLGQAGQIGRLGQGIGALGTGFGQLGLGGAGQLANIGQAMGGIGGRQGQLGQGLGALGMNQAKLGEAAQGLGANDINMLLRLGGGEQQQRQAELDAMRQTQYQNVMAPFQQLGFYSDVFQGLPMGQTSIGTQRTPNPSLFSQIAGLGLGIAGLGGLGFARGGRV